MKRLVRKEFPSQYQQVAHILNGHNTEKLTTQLLDGLPEERKKWFWDKWTSRRAQTKLDHQGNDTLRTERKKEERKEAKRQKVV